MPTNAANQMLETYHTRIDAFLEQILSPHPDTPEKLTNAMRYSVLNGGKRLRPLIVYSVGTLYGHALSALDVAAAAIELIHCYSLVHDDLPCMDDDDFRRGKPSCHKQFDEASAVLVGDSLQTLAFELLASHHMEGVSTENRLSLITTLSQASGKTGMCSGQMLDLELNDVQTPKQLEDRFAKKTGALFEASFLLGALGKTTHLQVLRDLGYDFGLAFQIQDDLHDHDADAHPERYIELVGEKSAQSKLQGLQENLTTTIKRFEQHDVLLALLQKALPI